MDKLKIEEYLNDSKFKDMTMIQINSYELMLKRKGLKDVTIERKIKNLLDFYIHLTTIKINTKRRIKLTELNNIAFTYVRDGYFGANENIENEGTFPYRQNIYYNIQQGINYIYEDMLIKGEQIIKPLTQDQKDILDSISKNKWFRTVTTKENENETFYDSLQVQLIEKLGIKVYYIEKQYNKQLIKNAEIKEAFYNMYNEIRKRNRDLVVNGYNIYVKNYESKHKPNRTA